MKNRIIAEVMSVSPDLVDRRVEFARCFKVLSQALPIDPELFVLPTQSIPELNEVSPAGGLFETERPPPRSHTLIVPGLLGDTVASIVAPFFSARQALAVQGYCTQIAWVNGRRGCDYNAVALKNEILGAADRAGAPVNIIAYSKGCADVFHMLAKYSETHAAVAALVSYAGVVRGSPLARQTSWITRKMLQYVPLPGFGFGDDRAISDLGTVFRNQWLEANPLPASIRYASFAAAPSRHQVSRILKSSYDKLSAFDPLNDSQVLWQDMLIPGSELLAVVQADHWALALPIDKRLPTLANKFIDKNEFPRKLMLRAIIDYLEKDTADVII